MASVIGTRRKKFWEDNGFLVFPGFFSDVEVTHVREAYDRTWETMPPWVVVDDLVNKRRCRITALSDEERRHNFKVNDLYVIEPAIRDVVLSERLGMVLQELLGDEPAICNTLNFDKGSQQTDHLDTLYMTPVSERGLTATWMALEDATADAGPLRYFPGSNQIKPFRFSTGSMRQVDSEVHIWSDYMAEQIEKLGLEEQRFMASTGDLFIWHALLLHGGSAIKDMSLTRESLVTHYWTQTDCETGSWDLRPAPGGWWINKPALDVPEEHPPAPSGDQVVDFPAQLSVTADRVSPEADLRERMDALEGARD